jgi:hypothetical protein
MTDASTALRWARKYQELGLSPLPSDTEDKRPVKSIGAYGHFRVCGVPEWIYTEKHWTTTNIQLFCGAQAAGWQKIVVVDCDGDEARDVWRRMCEDHAFAPSTWVSLTPSGGRHFYFSLPDTALECPTKLLWGLWDTYGTSGAGEWVHHKEVRLLGDGSLVVAPPSIHVKLGTEYRWATGRAPHERLIAQAPPWLMSAPGIVSPNTDPLDIDRIVPKPRHARTHGAKYTIRELRDMVTNSISPEQRIEFARSWGLRFATDKPSAKGWHECHRVGQKDKSPSAGFHAETGVYRDAKDGSTMSFFDLGTELGAFSHWTESVIWCAGQLRITGDE